MHQKRPAGAGPAGLVRAVRAGLHTHSRSVAGAAVPLVREEEDERRETDQQVDESLDRRPGAEEEIHDVPIAAHIRPERHEAPVEAADDDECERCAM